MKAHFEMMAGYNAWANGRVYAAAAALSDDDYRRDRGAFFGSLHGTLNHLYVTDVIWLSRLRGQPNPPWALDHIAHAAFSDLHARRKRLDSDILCYVLGLDADALDGEISYRRTAVPEPVTQPLTQTLAHLFNHQTHHRGQCHAMLTQLAGDAPSLDLLVYQRER